LCNVEDFRLDDDGMKFDMIVSNPPYIPQADMATLSEDVSNFESHTALCGGNDGLDVVRAIIKKLPEWMESGCSCWMEVDPTHPGMLQELLMDDPDVDFDATLRDMFGRERFVKLVVR
jgi:release factor glutamine methyltransferase